MQFFIDTINQQVHAFEDDVVVHESNGVYSFEGETGMPLDVPDTLEPYTPPVPSAEEVAAQQSAAAAAALAMRANAALAAGLTVTSTGTPAINGTYSCDSLSQMDIISIETSLNAGKGFPGGAATFSYPDAAGAMHPFSDVNFTDFAAAIRDYVYALKTVMAGASTTLPSGIVTIA